MFSWPSCPLYDYQFQPREVKARTKCPSCGTRVKLDTRYATLKGVACFGALLGACYALGVRGVALVIIPLLLIFPLFAAVAFISTALVGSRFVFDNDGTEFRITPRWPPPPPPPPEKGQ